MFKCTKCNKQFKFDSELTRHKNRKIPCNAPNKEYKCDICSVKFKCPFDKNKHEKTQKHINLQLNHNATNTLDKLIKKKLLLENENKELKNKLNDLEKYHTN